MAKKNTEADVLGFMDRVASQSNSAPVQKVVPVEAPKAEAAPAKEEPKDKGAQLSVWIPKDLYKQAKLHGIQQELSLKEITIKALEAYLNK